MTLHIFPMGGGVVPFQVSLREVFSSRPDGHLDWDGAQDALHHGEVLLVVVGLEEGVAECEFEHDAADRPEVHWKILLNQINHFFRCIDGVVWWCH